MSKHGSAGYSKHYLEKNDSSFNSFDQASNHFFYGNKNDDSGGGVSTAPMGFSTALIGLSTICHVFFFRFFCKLV